MLAPDMSDCREIEADRPSPTPGRDCCWPIGDPLTTDFRYCRKTVARAGEPYCAEHRARAWRTPEDLVADRAIWRAEQKRRREDTAA